MSAGLRDQLITLERFTATQDDHNEDVETWASIGTEWAQVFYGRGDERRAAAREQGGQTATFQILSNELTTTLTIKDRISFNGEWDIHGISPDMPRRGFIEVTAMRGS